MNWIWEVSPFTFAFVTCFLGGGAAYLTGRAVARTWDSWTKLVIYMALLAVAVRFIHFSLFHGTFLLPLSHFAGAFYHLVVDFVVLMGFAAAGRQITRAGQMALQYAFRFKRNGPVSWTERH